MRGFNTRYEKALSSVLKKTPELEKIPSNNSTAPQIVNLVSTVHLLPQVKIPGTKKLLHRLPLESIAVKMKACSQFAPRQFAANILRFTDSITDTTSLIFRSGKIVTVRGLSLNHTRLISQQFRMVIERVQTLAKDPETGKIISTTLEGRTTYNNLSVHNVVGSGFLGVKVDLPKLQEAAPHCCQYMPDIFPGLMFQTWITQSQRCECSMSIKDEDFEDDDERAAEQIIDLKAKCVCVVKCLIFDSGELVITGGRDVDVVYKVFYQIQELAQHFKDNDGKDIPKEQRFNHRLAKLMIRLADPDSDKKSKNQQGPSNKAVLVATDGLHVVTVVKQNSKRKRKKVELPTLTEDQAVAAVMIGLDNLKGNQRLKKAKKNTKVLDPKVTSLMKFAAAGKIQQLNMVLSMDPEQIHAKDGAGNTVLDRMRQTPRAEQTPQHIEVMDILKKHI